MASVPNCEHCGAPALNVNGRGEHTGRHTSIEECLQNMNARITAQAENVKKARARTHAALQALDGAHDLYMEAPRSSFDGTYEKLYAATRELVEAIDFLTREAL